MFNTNSKHIKTRKGIQKIEQEHAQPETFITLVLSNKISVT